MFFVKSICNLFTTNSELERIKELELINNEIDAAIERDRKNENSFYGNQDESEEKELTKNDQETSECFKKIGVVTQMKSNHGVIDNSYMFNVNKVSKNINDLKIGYKVEYLAYKSNEEDSDLRICKITDIVEYSWERTTEEEIEKAVEELRHNNPMCFSKHERNIMGTIIERREHFIRVESDTDDEIEIDLETVSIEFVPQLGDRLVLRCIVQSDEKYVDCKGEILECKSISYVRKKTLNGTVSKVEHDWGAIDNEAYFMFEVLDMGYKPTKGDQVLADIIENEAIEPFNFRSVKVTLLEKVSNDLEITEKNQEKNYLFQNKNGIEVTDRIRFKFDKLDQINTKYLVVSNTSGYVQEIIRYVFRTGISNSQLRLRNSHEIRGNLNLQPGSSITFQINAKSKRFGLSSEIFELHFKTFVIARNIEIEVGEIKEYDNNCNQIIDNNKRFGGNSMKQKFHNAKLKWNNMQKRNLVPGVSAATRPRFIKQHIQLYDVPERLKDAVLTAENPESLAENIEATYSSLREELKPEFYFQRFSALLHLEEIERFTQMRQYDRDRTHFKKEGQYLSLNIENLAEKRPSLIIGDSIHATNPWAEEECNNKAYQGFIHKVQHNKILLKFNESFHSKYNGEDYRLEFYFSRSNFRKMHHSIQYLQSCLGNEFLFPTKVITNNSIQCNVELNENDELVDKSLGKTTSWYNTDLNHYQKVAIKNILRGEARPMPYVIFGPPGTGKTLTVIETILQLFKNCPSSRLLIGTPTNSSADLIATRLVESKVLIPGDFIRLVGQNIIERDLIPEHLKPYSATVDIALDGTTKNEMVTTDSGLKLKCQSKYLGSHRIIISTCMTLGSLIYLGYPKSQFSHVIIDEAGQSIEPEIMTVIKQVDGNGGQIILAGDPLQLGPIVIQKYAAAKGLETSFLVRLLSTQPYSKDKIRFPQTGYNPTLITKLICSYRSISSILDSYNNFFYDSELIPMIKGKDCKENVILRSLETILFKNFGKRSVDHGLLFWGVRGQNRQDSDSPSWYNGEEASQLYLFSLKLLKEGIKPRQIGIITPYQKQVRKIRQLFEAADIAELPKVGTVEEFQGQERDIILISTVRSSKALIQADLKYSLGFLQSSKRMNVAISRARALLVIFGNPHLLVLDSNWEKLIRYCIEKNAYSGCDLPSNLEIENQI